MVNVPGAGVILLLEAKTAMKDILGDAATPEVMEAWTEAYNSLADIFITREKEIYRQQDKKMQAKLK